MSFWKNKHGHPFFKPFYELIKCGLSVCASVEMCGIIFITTNLNGGISFKPERKWEWEKRIWSSENHETRTKNRIQNQSIHEREMISCIHNRHRYSTACPDHFYLYSRKK